MTGLLVLTLFAFQTWNGGLTLLIVLLTSITIYYLDLIPGFGILTVKLWTPLQGHGTSTTTGFVRHLTSFHGLWGTCGLAARKVLWSFRFGVLLHFGLYTTDGSHLAHFVDDWVDLPPLKTTFCMGRHSAGGFGRENLNFRVLAVRINFRSVRFFITGFCTIHQGWCSQSSTA